MKPVHTFDPLTKIRKGCAFFAEGIRWLVSASVGIHVSLPMGNVFNDIYFFPHYNP